MHAALYVSVWICTVQLFESGHLLQIAALQQEFQTSRDRPARRPTAARRGRANIIFLVCKRTWIICHAAALTRIGTLGLSLWLVPRTRRGWVTVGTCRLPLPRLHACLFHPLRAGLAHGVHLHAWNQVLDPGHPHRAPVRAPRPSHHRSGAGAAYLSPRHAGSAVVRGHKAVAQGIWFVSHIFARCVSQKTYGHATSTTCKNVRQNLIPRATA